MTSYLGKSCSFGLLRVPFVNCRQCMYLVISLLVLRAGSVGFLLLQCSSGVVRHPRDLQVSVQHVSVESSSLLHHSIYL